jgi:hypothetical protein
LIIDVIDYSEMKNGREQLQLFHEATNNKNNKFTDGITVVGARALPKPTQPSEILVRYEMPGKMRHPHTGSHTVAMFTPAYIHTRVSFMREI